MREISPAVGISVDDYIARFVPDAFKPFIAEIRRQKVAGLRRVPSATLIDKSTILTTEIRASLLDQIAKLVDENYVGRGEMCLQFADLLNRALNKLGFPARAVVGKAIYYDPKGGEIFRWDHAWVRIGDEIVDGNVDSIPENPMVPNAVQVSPYWGTVKETPSDRKLQEDHGRQLPPDVDVEELWWPELSSFLDSLLKS
jgi:hypothetical protein